MKVGVLTSSRADYGIYLPLLQALQRDSYFDLGLIAFGTHLSSFHGRTVDKIQQDGFRIDYEVEHVLTSDSPGAIASSMALATLKFAEIWKMSRDRYDLVFCLGDRYEMFAAVSAATPFRIPFAHLHGGETTLGAIDNEYRHCLTLFSTIHFVATKAYAKRVAEIKGSGEHVYTVGSLSLENLASLQLLSAGEFKDQFGIDLSKPTILVTYHPETLSNDNDIKAQELIKALSHFLDYQIIITMPNADTMGNTMRNVYVQFSSEHPNVFLVENFGTLGYFSCMEMCQLVVGNSSSGIIEAASFSKYIVNIGDRQKGRAVSDNVFTCKANAAFIVEACKAAIKRGEYKGTNIYYKKNVVSEIITVLKEWKQ